MRIPLNNSHMGKAAQQTMSSKFSCLDADNFMGGRVEGWKIAEDSGCLFTCALALCALLFISFIVHYLMHSHITFDENDV